MIINFTATQDPYDPDLWTFSGTVTQCEDVADLEVFFGGLMDTETTMTDGQGNFHLTRLIFESGPVTAETLSHEGEPSNLVDVEI